MPARQSPLEFRRRLRREGSEAEQHLWRRLRRRSMGAKFRRQHTVGPYTLDFFCVDASLCVELDGSEHFTPGGAARDAARDAFLAARGIHVVRFTAGEVFTEEEMVLERIWREIQHSVRPPSP